VSTTDDTQHARVDPAVDPGDLFGDELDSLPERHLATVGPDDQDDRVDGEDLVQQLIVDPNDVGFYYVRVMQWIALHPDIPHTAFRVYSVVRSLYTHRRDLRSISLDELRWLTPGVNGKPMSETVLRDALKVLERFGLVTNPDGKAKSWLLRDPDTGEFVQRTERTLQLGTLPPEGLDYPGWRNSFDKLAGYRQGWDGKGRRRRRGPRRRPPWGQLRTRRSAPSTEIRWRCTEIRWRATEFRWRCTEIR
jgi:hypothetical protein